MVDILQMVLQFLNVNCSIVQCYYPNIFEGLFYLILLPSLLIILFIWFLSGAVIGKFGTHKGLQLIISLAVYVFLIIEGFYTFFISMSFIWIVVVIVVGILFFIIRHITGGGGTGGGGALPAPRGGVPGGGLIGFGAKKLKGGGKADIEKQIDDRLSNMKAIINQIRKPTTGTDVGTLIARYWQVKEATESAIKSLEQMVGWPASKGVTNKYWKRISELTEEFENLEKQTRRAA